MKKERYDMAHKMVLFQTFHCLLTTKELNIWEVFIRDNEIYAEYIRATILYESIKLSTNTTESISSIYEQLLETDTDLRSLTRKLFKIADEWYKALMLSDDEKKIKVSVAVLPPKRKSDKK